MPADRLSAYEAAWKAHEQARRSMLREQYGWLYADGPLKRFDTPADYLDREQRK